MIVHNGIKVRIVIGEADIAEYLVEKDLAQRKVTCWIPSQVGKEFAIIVMNDRQDECHITVKADGTIANTPIMRRLDTRNVAFYRESRLVKRPFVFAKLDLVDDDDLLNTAETHLGEIELACWNIRSLEMRETQHFNKTFPENKRVHERSKKGIGQHIGLGRAVSSQKQSTMVHVKKSDHVVTFVFRYRPIDYLQAQGITLPVDPPQQRTISGADATRSSRPEGSVPDGRKTEVVVKEEYVETSYGEDDEIRALPKRKKGGVQAPRKRVKRESEVPPTFVPGQIIDLT